MSSRVNLNDNISDVYPFTVGGKDFDLKYPTLKDIEPINKLNENRAKAVEKEDTDEIAKIDKELEKTMYKLIIPVGHDTPIDKVLETQPFPVIKAFNKMLTDQFSAE